MPPRVSVHLPSYQQREFLRDAIESVLAQEYPALEIVVGDDGSADGTHEMLREYEARYPGLFVLALDSQNRGTTANWNRILPRCTGKYVAWLDGDDLWLPGKLHRQVAYMEANPALALSYTNAEVFESSTGRALRLQHGPRRNPFRAGGGAEMLRSATFFVTSTVVALRSALPEWGADERLPWISDWLLWVDITRNGEIGFVPEVFTRYRIHGSNITRRGDSILADQERALEIVEERYPDYAGRASGARAEMLWYHGLRYLATGEPARADEMFRRSFREQFRTHNVSTAQKLFIRALMTGGVLRAAVPAYTLSRRALGALRRVVGG
jgi:glycosyltransferase involved in cell wall biosynthesis